MSDKEALEIAKEELKRCTCQIEFGYLNPGLRQIYSKRADWLSIVIYIAEKQMEAENG